MNARFTELYKQAWGHFPCPTGEPELEKFAELIVRDCIDIISPYTIRMGRPGEEYLHPIQEIKTHFGVK